MSSQWYPHVFDYLNHIEYLRAVRAAAQDHSRGSAYSLTSMARWAGLKARSQMHEILYGVRERSVASTVDEPEDEPGGPLECPEGDDPPSRGAVRHKKLKVDHAARLAEHLFCPTRLDHGPDQAPAIRYFTLLARYFDLPREEAEVLQRDILALRRTHGRRVLRPEADDALRYFGGWVLQPLRQLVLLDDFRPDGEWMSQRLGRRATAAEAEEAFQWLQDRGHIVQRGERWCLERSAVIAPQEVDQVPGYRELLRGAVAHTYLRALTIAGDSIDGVESSQRLLRMKVVNLSRSAFGRIRQELEDLIQRVEDEVVADEAPTEEVYQLLLTLVPISTRDQDEDGGAMSNDIEN